MADAQVTCVNRQSHGGDAHEGITHLGGSGWFKTRQEVINSIEAGTNTFFTLAQGVRANVGVVNGPNGKYLRTHADGRYNDNLLYLSRCTS